MIQIMIEGDPIPASRPRFNGRRCYQPKRNMEYRSLVQASAYAAMFGKQPMTGELSAVVKIYRRFKPTARNFGDVDNHLKAIFDALNKIAYLDDSQICRCLVEKFKDAKRPRVEIEIRSDDNVKTTARGILP